MPPSPLDDDPPVDPPIEPPLDAPLDLEQFYADRSAADDDDYEVEPLDADVVAAEQRRAREQVDEAESAIDVDEIYREMQRGDDFDAAFDAIRARFSLRSILIAMTVLAVILGIGGSGLLNGATFAGFIALSLMVLGGAHAYLNFRESRRREALVAKRTRELNRRRRAAAGGDMYDTADDDDEPLIVERTFAEDARAAWLTVTRFGMKEMLLAMAGASVLLALLVLAGSPMRAAAGLGVLAITGFGLQAAEINVPRPLVLIWWFSLIGFASLLLLSVVLGALEVTLGIGFFDAGLE